MQRKLIFACGIAALGLLAYMMYSSKKTQSDGSIAWIDEASVRSTKDNAQPSIYNFERMLDVMKRTKEIKTLFYDNFKFDNRRQKRIDVKKMRDLLSELYREKVCLQKYFWEERVRYTSGIPPKQKKKKQYYQKVIDQCIADLEKILRRI